MQRSTSQLQASTSHLAPRQARAAHACVHLRRPLRRAVHCSRPAWQQQQREQHAHPRLFPRDVAASAAADPEQDYSNIHPNVVSLDDFKDLKLQGDKIAGDLARRVDSGEIGGEDRLQQDYGLLSDKFEELSAEVVEGLAGTSVYLVGMMGSGKSTVGKMLANILKYCFFDTDKLIEEAAGKSVADIFEQDGEEEFRQAETDVLKELMPFRDLVVATGGGAVLRRENWGAMQQAVVVWLQGPPHLLATRVVAQGRGSRPLLAGGEEQDKHSATTEKLDGILSKRRELYRSADIHVSIEGLAKDKDLGAPSAVVVYRILDAINQRIKEAAAEREQKKNFTIEGLDAAPSTMKVVDQPIDGLALDDTKEE